MMKMPWVTPGARMDVDADRFVLHTLPVARNGDSHVCQGHAAAAVDNRGAPHTLAVEGWKIVTVVHVLHHDQQVTCTP